MDEVTAANDISVSVEIFVFLPYDAQCDRIRSSKLQRNDRLEISQKHGDQVDFRNMQRLPQSLKYEFE